MTTDYVIQCDWRGFKAAFYPLLEKAVDDGLIADEDDTMAIIAPILGDFISLHPVRESA